MPYIITEPCSEIKDKACVEACPVDCIYDVGSQLMINPEECILCGACVPECPPDAIFYDEDETIKAEGTDESVKKNYEFFGFDYPKDKF